MRAETMHVFSKSTTPTKIVTDSGEMIDELVGRTLGARTVRHSVAHVTIPHGKSAFRHYHPESEESYYIIQGTAWMEINGEARELFPGDAVLIPARSVHKITNRNEEDLVFVVVCVPAWEPTNTVWLETAPE
jgi:mannose-6-phosphate isomerase-like protein (cupin superfamily)